MRELSRSFKPHIWVNVHSGMEVMQLFCSVDILYVTRNTKVRSEYICTKATKKNCHFDPQGQVRLSWLPPVSKLLSCMFAILALTNLGDLFTP